MRQIIAMLMMLGAWCAVWAQQPADSLVKAAAVVEGLFFDKSVPVRNIMPENSSGAVIKDPDGAIVMAVYLPEGCELNSETKASAIPAARVMHADQLLRDYEGRRPAKKLTPGVKVGEPMVKFEYPDTEGNVWNNGVLKGRGYVINLWQKECGPCRREMPELSTWKEKFQDVVFLSASRHDTDEIEPIVTRHNFTWHHLRKAKDLVSLVGAEGFPLTIVVDAEGTVRYAVTGASPEHQAAALEAIRSL